MFFSLDIFTGNILLSDDLHEMNMFRCHAGSFYFKVMAFNMRSALETFQCMAEIVFNDLPFVFVYIDGIFIRSSR